MSMRYPGSSDLSGEDGCEDAPHRYAQAMVPLSLPGKSSVPPYARP